MLGLFLSLVLVGSSAVMPTAPSITPSVQQLAVEHCQEGPIQRTSGTFLHQPAHQVLEVDRSIAYNSEGPVCVFSAGVADADNPYNSRMQNTFWGARGPGQTFSDGFWHSPEMGGSFKARVVRVLPGDMDQVLIIQSFSGDDAGPLHAIIVVFDPDHGTWRNILDIAGVGQLDVTVSNYDVTVRGLDPDGRCHLCGPVHEFHMRYDPQADALALENPTPQNINFYKDLVERRKKAHL